MLSKSDNAKKMSVQIYKRADYIIAERKSSMRMNNVIKKNEKIDKYQKQMYKELKKNKHKFNMLDQAKQPFDQDIFQKQSEEYQINQRLGKLYVELQHQYEQIKRHSCFIEFRRDSYLQRIKACWDKIDIIIKNKKGKFKIQDLDLELQNIKEQIVIIENDQDLKEFFTKSFYNEDIDKLFKQVQLDQQIMFKKDVKLNKATLEQYQKDKQKIQKKLDSLYQLIQMEIYNLEVKNQEIVKQQNKKQFLEESLKEIQDFLKQIKTSISTNDQIKERTPAQLKQKLMEQIKQIMQRYEGLIKEAQESIEKSNSKFDKGYENVINQFQQKFYDNSQKKPDPYFHFIFVLDASQRMKPYFSLLADAVKFFIETRLQNIQKDQKQDKVSIIKFNDTATVIHYTKNLDQVTKKIDEKVEGGTNFKIAFQSVKQLFDARKKTNEIPCIIIFTDGEDKDSLQSIPILRDMYKEQCNKENALFTFCIALGTKINIKNLHEVTQAGNGGDLSRELNGVQYSCFIQLQNSSDIKDSFLGIINVVKDFSNLETLKEVNRKYKEVFIQDKLNEIEKLNARRDKDIKQKKNEYQMLYGIGLENASFEKNTYFKLKEEYENKQCQMNEKIKKVLKKIQTLNHERIVLENSVETNKNDFLKKKDNLTKLIDQENNYRNLISTQSAEQKQQLGLKDLDEQKRVSYEESACNLIQIYKHFQIYYDILKNCFNEIKRDGIEAINALQNCDKVQDDDNIFFFKEIFEESLEDNQLDQKFPFSKLIEKILTDREQFNQKIIKVLSLMFHDVNDIIGTLVIQASDYDDQQAYKQALNSAIKIQRNKVENYLEKQFPPNKELIKLQEDLGQKKKEIDDLENDIEILENNEQNDKMALLIAKQKGKRLDMELKVLQAKYDKQIQLNTDIEEGLTGFEYLKFYFQNRYNLKKSEIPKNQLRESQTLIFQNQVAKLLQAQKETNMLTCEDEDEDEEFEYEHENSEQIDEDKETACSEYNQ